MGDFSNGYVCSTCMFADLLISLGAGAYNYPIMFTLLHDSLPTTKAEYGSYTWRLNAKDQAPRCDQHG